MPTNTRKVAIVTGAAQGIGRSIALRLAADGLDVALADLSSQSARLEELAAEIKSLHAEAKTLVVHVNVSKEEDVQKLVDETVKALGGLDVMVANAGVTTMGSIVEASLTEYDRVFDVNVKGTLLCYRAAAKVMLGQGRGGRIIGASSVAGKKGAPLCGIYCASKFAIRALTQATASELAKANITVNAYAAGLTETPMLHEMDARIADITKGPTTMFSNDYVPQIPIGRLARPEEISSVVSFLASDGAAYITGQSISVDGGLFFD